MKELSNLEVTRLRNFKGSTVEYVADILEVPEYEIVKLLSTGELQSVDILEQFKYDNDNKPISKYDFAVDNESLLKYFYLNVWERILDD